jgi:membrane protein DedA with SNARE-associated domain
MADMTAFLVITAIACLFWAVLAVGIGITVGRMIKTRDRRG